MDGDVNGHHLSFLSELYCQMFVERFEYLVCLSLALTFAIQFNLLHSETLGSYRKEFIDSKIGRW